MDILINLTESYDKLNLNVSDIVQNISNQITHLTEILDNNTKILINYTSDDLTCMNDINIKRIDNLKNNFINEIEYFIQNLIEINNNNNDVDEYIINELHDIITKPELSILRLENLLEYNINNYIKDTKKIINKLVNSLFNEYNVNYILYDYYNKNNDLVIKNFINEIDNNLFPSCDIKNLLENNNTENNNTENVNTENVNNNIQNKNDFENIIKNKYINLNIVENTDNIFKWNSDIVLYEIYNNDNTKKIYIYIDLFERDGKIENRNLLDLDISKIFCIVNYNSDYNMVFKYTCFLIDKYIT